MFQYILPIRLKEKLRSKYVVVDALGMRIIDDIARMNDQPVLANLVQLRL